MDENGRLKAASNVVIDLNARRRDLRVPTLLAAKLAEAAGADIQSCHPGTVEVTLSGTDPEIALLITIRAVNVYERAAEAYRLAGLPVPERITLGIERWNREHGY